MSYSSSISFSDYIYDDNYKHDKRYPKKEHNYNKKNDWIDSDGIDESIGHAFPKKQKYPHKKFDIYDSPPSYKHRDQYADYDRKHKNYGPRTPPHQFKKGYNLKRYGYPPKDYGYPPKDYRYPPRDYRYPPFQMPPFDFGYPQFPWLNDSFEKKKHRKYDGKNLHHGNYRDEHGKHNVHKKFRDFDKHYNEYDDDFYNKKFHRRSSPFDKHDYAYPPRNYYDVENHPYGSNDYIDDGYYMNKKYKSKYGDGCPDEGDHHGYVYYQPKHGKGYYDEW
jgi:hypothetical protein